MMFEEENALVLGKKLKTFLPPQRHGRFRNDPAP
jgi:hypothetical protein